MKVNRLNVKGWGVWYTYGRGVFDMLISPVLKVPFVEGSALLIAVKGTSLLFGIFIDC